MGRALLFASDCLIWLSRAKFGPDQLKFFEQLGDEIQGSLNQTKVEEILFDPPQFFFLLS